MDYEAVAAEFLRALRGHRSQTAFCRRLGYKSNVVYLWEHRRAWPTASKALWAADRVGVDVRLALQNFYRTDPEWLEEIDPHTPEGVSAILRDLRGHVRIADLAERTGRNRFAIARWLKGQAEPSLPEFLMMVECSSLRLIEFLEQFVEPDKLPSIREKAAQLRVARDLAYDAPWTQVVLRTLELEAYQALRKHRRGWIARRVGIRLEDEEASLDLLLRSGQIEWKDDRWLVRQALALDTRSNPKKARRVRGFWAREGARRADAGAPGLMYNLFSVSESDLEKLRDLQKDYLNQVRSIVAQSEPSERVVLAVDMLVELKQ